MSSAETRLETQRLGPLQVKVALICLLAQTFDGYDLNSIGIAVPALVRAWHIPGPAFASTFIMSSVGILIGALVSGPLGDRLGRKPVITASLVVLGVSSLACVYATTIPMLAGLRVFTGMGVGALFPATVALASDYLPERRRAVGIMIVFTGAPLGGFLGGVAVSRLLPLFDWPSVFVLGGVLPLLLLPVVMWLLPESPRFLLARGRLTTGSRRLMDRLGIDLAAPAQPVDVATGNPVAGLFRDGLAPVTVLVWILYFANLLSMFMIGYWMPTVLSMSGLAPADAVFAASLREAGPLVSVFLIVPLSTRFGPPNVLAVSLACGILAIAAIGLLALPHFALLAVILMVGACTVGSMTGVNGMTAALYPARVRTTGMGWALGVGRLGAIVGPWLGGALLTAGWPPRQIFLVACGTAFIATVCAVLLGVLRRRREPGPVLRRV